MQKQQQLTTYNLNLQFQLQLQLSICNLQFQYQWLAPATFCFGTCLARATPRFRLYLVEHRRLPHRPSSEPCRLWLFRPWSLLLPCCRNAQEALPNHALGACVKEVFHPRSSRTSPRSLRGSASSSPLIRRRQAARACRHRSADRVWSNSEMQPATSPCKQIG